MTESTAIPARLNEIIEDFRTMDKSEKLEALLEYAEQLPPLPEQFRTGKPLEHVDECATPIAIASERYGDQIAFHFDIPPESPTVRGFAEILRTGLVGVTPEDVINLPGDLYYTMGLQSALSPQRLNGMHFMLLHLKRAAARELTENKGRPS
jgi:cysteine desulfuration protein SufE